MNNINDLRESLFDTIQLLKTKKIDATTANSIANVAKNILQSAKLEMDFMKQTEQQRSAFFLEASKQQDLVDAKIRSEALRLLEKNEEEKSRAITAKAIGA